MSSTRENREKYEWLVLKNFHEMHLTGSRFLIATLSLQNHPIWLAPPSNDWSNPRQIQDSYNLITFEEGRLFGELITAPPPKSSRLFCSIPQTCDPASRLATRKSK